MRQLCNVIYTPGQAEGRFQLKQQASLAVSFTLSYLQIHSLATLPESIFSIIHCTRIPIASSVSKVSNLRPLDQAMPEARIRHFIAPRTHRFTFLLKPVGTGFLTAVFDLRVLLI